MKYIYIIFLSLTTVILSACAQTEPTATATLAPTQTPIPTEAPTETPTPDFAATESAQKTEQVGTMMETVNAELSALGFPTQGELVWMQSESIKIKENLQNFDGDPQALELDNPVGDFAMGVDVTWETVTGFSGCGIVFRAQEDFERGKQIRLFTIRLSGLPIWSFTLYRYGQFQADLALDANSAIKNAQDSTNHYLLIVQGSTPYLYANGTRIASTTLPIDLVEGGIGFFAWEDSGITTCTFENGWILEY